jgi:hypothetical protein
LLEFSGGVVFTVGGPDAGVFHVVEVDLPTREDVSRGRCVGGRGMRDLQSLKGQPLGARWPALTGGTVAAVENVRMDTAGNDSGSISLNITAEGGLLRPQSIQPFCFNKSDREALGVRNAGVIDTMRNILVRRYVMELHSLIVTICTMIWMRQRNVPTKGLRSVKVNLMSGNGSI